MTGIQFLRDVVGEEKFRKLWDKHCGEDYSYDSDKTMETLLYSIAAFHKTEISTHIIKEYRHEIGLQKRNLKPKKPEPEPKPEHYDGEPCNLPVWGTNKEQAKGLRFEYVAKRPWVKGEWVAGRHGFIVKTVSDYYSGQLRKNCAIFWVLRAIPEFTNLVPAIETTPEPITDRELLVSILGVLVEIRDTMNEYWGLHTK